MKLLCLLFASLAVASATSQYTTSQIALNCIEGCKCRESFQVLNIYECDKPLILNKNLFKGGLKSFNAIGFENLFIPQIEKNAFDDFLLNDVVMDNCSIGAIDENAFSSIKTLKFSNCLFKSSPDLASESLEELHYGDCKLSVTPALDRLPSLTFLNLTGNDIKYFDIITFANLINLAELYLSKNNIVRLHDNLFVNNQQLNILHLDRNPLKYFSLNTSNNLETLSLKSCKLTNFDENVSVFLNSISELNLNDNYISDLTAESFIHMTKLFSVDLSYNRLRKLDANIFSRNIELEKIILDGNDFKDLPSFVLYNNKPFSVYSFSCNNCGLKKLSSSTFKNMPAIIFMSLADNEFESVDEMFSKTVSLRNLDISNNRIPTIGLNAFIHNKDLQSLILTGNPLRVLNPNVFDQNYVLTKIDARDTQLTTLWSNRTPIPSLQQLLISNNKLQTITKEDLLVVPNLTGIDLKNNFIKLNDSHCDFINWLETKSKINAVEFTDTKEEFNHHLFMDTADWKLIPWKDIFNVSCPETLQDVFYEATENEMESTESPYYSDEDEDDDDENYHYLYADMADENSTLIRASNIISITSVFVVTALAVLTVAVTITLCILKRNSAFNMQKANLPHFKIPLWDTQPGHKKHSGSVYRPLSEDLSGPKTPKFSRYEFSATPSVHSINS